MNQQQQVFYTEALTNYGMKSVVYYLKCHKHTVKNSDPNLNNDYEDHEILERINMFKANPYIERPEPEVQYAVNGKNLKEIYAELKESKYIGYSSIMILLNMHCKCQTQILRKLMWAMEKNDNLRLKSKLVVTVEPPKSKVAFKNPNDNNYKQQFVEKYSKVIEKNNIVFPKKDRMVTVQLGLNESLEISDIEKFYENLQNFKVNQMDNIVFMRIFMKKSTNFLRNYDIIQFFYWSYVNFTEPMHEILGTYAVLSKNFDAIVSTSTNANLYFYSINPTLAIIINNYYFSNDDGGNREGSQQDLLNMIRTLKLAGIPQILLQDWNKKQLLELFEYLKNKDFYPLENFLFIMMSHGGSNVIYTHDGELNITEDIIKPLQSNESLKQVNKIIAVNACRGPIQIPEADDDDFDEIKPTDSSHLDTNTFLAFSVPDQVKSYRCKHKGSPFICLFCKYFRSITHKSTLRELIAKVDKELTTYDYYYGLKQCAELVTKDPSKTCNIIPTPSEGCDMVKLIDSLVTDFEELCGVDGKREDHKLLTSFLVFGTLKNMKLCENPLFHKIFSNELDYDYCPIVNESEYMH